MSNRSLRSPGTSHEPDNLPPRFRREVDYYLLNDGSDEEAVPEDRLPKVPRLDSESTIDGSVDNVARTNVLPEESASQVLEDTSVAGSTSHTSKRARARPVTEWLWATSLSQNYPISMHWQQFGFVFFFVGYLFVFLYAHMGTVPFFCSSFIFV
ncbi:hypothetical protein V1506DRAFT_107640 [Lipomyces tetrasporus]